MITKPKLLLQQPLINLFTNNGNFPTSRSNPTDATTSAPKTIRRGPKPRKESAETANKYTNHDRSKPMTSAKQKPVIRQQNHTEISDNNEDYYEIDKVLAKRIRNNKEEYLIHWKNYSDKGNTREPRDNLNKEALEYIRKYNI